MGFLNNLLAGKGMVDYRFVSTHGTTILHGSRERKSENLTNEKFMNESISNVGQNSVATASH